MRTVSELRTALRGPRRDGSRIGLVPTMGALHEGHLSLIRRARADCELVVVSLFVNPAQFGPTEDMSAYPRDEARDATLAADAGADLLFAPTLEEVYPPGFATTVNVAGATARLEGEHRPGHFDGVATVVCKLLNMAQPDVAYFGQKDAQQAAVIRRLVRDLDMPVAVEVCPTVREPNGLALSSRNAYLSPDERPRAVALKQALDAITDAVAAGAADPIAAGRAAMSELGVEPEYVALVDPDTFEPAEPYNGPVLAAVAARVGRARLIDNTLITSNGRS